METATDLDAMTIEEYDASLEAKYPGDTLAGHYKEYRFDPDCTCSNCLE
jgi:hypothetical protein